MGTSRGTVLYFQPAMTMIFDCQALTFALIAIHLNSLNATMPLLMAVEILVLDS